jgi:nucleoside-triphosphatase
MNIFLTGEIQIGKSTVIKKTLAILAMNYGGFRTTFGADRANPSRCLYIHEASAPPEFDAEHVVVRFRENGPPVSLPERFDALGAEYIAHARAHTPLIVMDECGSLERNAVHFQQEILSALDGGKPVLGVVKKDAVGWTDRIRNHPKVMLLTVNEDNRDALPEYIANLILGIE